MGPQLTTATRLHLEGKVELVEQVTERCRYLRERLREGQTVTPHFADELKQTAELLERTERFSLPARLESSEAQIFEAMQQAMLREEARLFKALHRRFARLPDKAPAALPEALRLLATKGEPQYLYTGRSVFRRYWPYLLFLLALGVDLFSRHAMFAIYLPVWFSSFPRSGRFWLTETELVWKPFFGKKQVFDLRHLTVNEIHVEKGVLSLGLKKTVRFTGDEQALASQIETLIWRRDMENQRLAEQNRPPVGSDPEGFDEALVLQEKLSKSSGE